VACTPLRREGDGTLATLAMLAMLDKLTGSASVSILLAGPTTPGLAQHPPAASADAAAAGSMATRGGLHSPEGEGK